MTIVNSIPIKYKLPFLAAGLSLFTGVVLELVVYMNTRSERLGNAADILSEGLKNLKNELTRKIENRFTSLRSLPSNREIADAIRLLSMTFLTEPETRDELFDQYVTSNPNASGKHSLLSRGAGKESYNLAHAKIHPSLLSSLNNNSLYDILLFDSSFNNLYSVAKEPDFLQNFETGGLSESPLGEVLRRGKSGRLGEVFASHFEAYAPSNGDAAAFMATQIADSQGVVLGFIAVQLPADELSIDLYNLSLLGTSGDVYLIDDQGRAQTASKYPGHFNLFDELPDPPQILAAQAGQSKAFYQVPLTSGELGFAVTTSFSAAGETWSIVAERDYSDVMGFANQSILNSLLVGGVIISITLFIGVTVSRSIVIPINNLGASLNTMAAGETDIKILDLDRDDELGEMAIALDGLLNTLKTAYTAETERTQMQNEVQLVLQKLSGARELLASGDLSQEIVEVFTNDYDTLRQDFNATLVRLRMTLSNVVDASENIRNRTAEIATASEDLARRTENQAAALEQTAAALDMLTTSLNNATRGAQEVEALTRKARVEADESSGVVQSAVDAMSKIEKSSDQISKIIGAIDDIAFQTNLLALNAGVEAARAGEAGKGFAIFASEVRALTLRSSSATNEIKSLIGDSAQHVRDGVEHVGKAGSAFMNIAGSVADISSHVSNIAASSVEQSAGLTEINLGISQLDLVTQQNAAMAQETTAASHALRQDAVGLVKLIWVFILQQVTKMTASLKEFDMRVLAENWSNPETTSNGIPKRLQMVRLSDANVQSAWQDF